MASTTSPLRFTAIPWQWRDTRWLGPIGLTPAKDDSHTTVIGANEDTYKTEMECVPCAACTTNGAQQQAQQQVQLQAQLQALLQTQQQSQRQTQQQAQFTQPPPCASLKLGVQPIAPPTSFAAAQLSAAPAVAAVQPLPAPAVPACSFW